MIILLFFMHCWSVEFLCQTHRFFYGSVFFLLSLRNSSQPGAILHITLLCIQSVLYASGIHLSLVEEDMSTLLDAAKIRDVYSY